MRITMRRLRRVLEVAMAQSDDDVLLADMRRFFLQEADDGVPAHVGAYAPFDMERDHTGKASTPWYRSPGLATGGDGDPGRTGDPHAYLGMHPPAAAGQAARLAPPIWQLTAGSDTSKVLGANARPATPEVPSEDGTEEDETGSGGAQGEEGEGTDAGEAQGQEQDGRSAQRGRD